MIAARVGIADLTAARAGGGSDLTASRAEGSEFSGTGGRKGVIITDSGIDNGSFSII